MTSSRRENTGTGATSGGKNAAAKLKSHLGASLIDYFRGLLSFGEFLAIREKS